MKHEAWTLSPIGIDTPVFDFSGHIQEEVLSLSGGIHLKTRYRGGSLVIQENLPGQPIHMRVAGDHLIILFDRIPWQFRIDDVAEGIQAFSSDDTSYFHNLWWEHHRHLLNGSDKLSLLASHISSEELFSPKRIISLGSFLGYYGPWDLVEMEHDYQRLTLTSILLGWPVSGMIAEEGEEPTPAWSGHQWAQAIIDAPLNQLLPKRVTQTAAAHSARFN